MIYRVISFGAVRPAVIPMPAQIIVNVPLCQNAIFGEAAKSQLPVTDTIVVPGWPQTPSPPESGLLGNCIKGICLQREGA